MTSPFGRPGRSSARGISVVVPVGSAGPDLATQLDAVRSQIVGVPFEIVLSVNSPSAAVRSGADALVVSAADERVRSVDSSGRPGAAHARNVGVAHARHEMLAFCDADDLVRPGWLAAAVEGLAEHDAVSGRVVDVFERQRAAAWHPPATDGDLPSFLGRRYVLTGNLAVWRDAFDAAGGFDETVLRGEDIAFGWALQHAGCSIGYRDDMTIDYRHPGGALAMVRRHYAYGRGMSQVLARYGAPPTGGRPGGDSAGARQRGLRRWLAGALPANAQSVRRRTVMGTVRRAAIAAGRVRGMAGRTPMQSDRRVAYLMTHYPSVTHTFIAREIAALRSMGWDVATIAINPPRDIDVVDPSAAAEAAVTVVLKRLPVRALVATVARAAVHPFALLTTLRAAGAGTGWDLGRRFRRTMQAGEGLLVHHRCVTLGLSHIHAHFGQAPANIAWFATLYGNAVGAQRWTWSMTIHGPQDCLNEPAGLLERKVASASLVIAVCDYTRAQLLRLVPVEQWSKVVVVRCGIELDRWPDHVGSPAGHRVRMLMVARVSPEKGHHVALEALDRLRSDGIDVELELVGPGDVDTELGADIARLGLQAIVSARGPLVPELVTEALRDADVVWMPSFAEGLPATLVEAMAVGVPVVASAISGIPELVEHGVTGFLVAPGRADELASATVALIEAPQLASGMAAEGRRRVGGLYDIRTTTSELAKVLGRVVAR